MIKYKGAFDSFNKIILKVKTTSDFGEVLAKDIYLINYP